MATQLVCYCGVTAARGFTAGSRAVFIADVSNMDALRA